MNPKVLITPVIGLPKVDGWAQVVSKADHSLVIAFSVFGSQAGNVGRDLVDLIKDAQQESAPALYAFLKKLIRIVEDKDCLLEMAAILFLSEKTILAVSSGSILLKRNDKVGNVISSVNGIKLIEGEYKPGDILILMTKSAREFEEDVILKLSQGLDAETIVSSLMPGLQNTPDSSLTAMAFISEDSVGTGYQPVRKHQPVHENEAVGNHQPVRHDQQSVRAADPAVHETTPDPAIKKTNYLNLIKNFFNILSKAIKFIFINLIKLLKFLFKFIKTAFSKNIYLNQEKNQKKIIKYFFLILFLAILILGPVIYFKARANRQLKSAQEQASAYLSQIAEAKQLAGDNPIQARELLNQAVDNLSALEQNYQSKKTALKYLSNLKQDAAGFLDSISAQEELHDLDVFYDFKNDNFIANRVSLSENQIAFLDTDQQKIIALNLDSKNVQEVELEKINKLRDLYLFNKSIYLLSENISRLNLRNNQSETLITESKADDKLINFFNNNLYILNLEQRNIFKYSYDGEAEKWNGPIRWVKSAPGVDFEQITDLAIDGDVWLSSKTGQIFKLTSGTLQDFKIIGLEKEFSSALFIFTQENLNNLYILEPTQQRLVVLNKNGEYQKEITSQSLATVSDFVVSEELSKAFLVSGTLLFELDL